MAILVRDRRAAAQAVVAALVGAELEQEAAAPAALAPEEVLVRQAAVPVVLAAELAAERVKAADDEKSLAAFC